MIQYLTVKLIPPNPYQPNDPWSTKGCVWVTPCTPEGLRLQDDKGQTLEVQIPERWLRKPAEIRAAMNNKAK